MVYIGDGSKRVNTSNLLILSSTYCHKNGGVNIRSLSSNWSFPKIWLPSHHPLLMGMFPEMNHPNYEATHMTMEAPSMTSRLRVAANSNDSNDGFLAGMAGRARCHRRPGFLRKSLPQGVPKESFQKYQSYLLRSVSFGGN